VSFRKPVIRGRRILRSAPFCAVDIARSEISWSFTLAAETSRAESCFADRPDVAFAISPSVLPLFVSCRSVATPVPRYCAVARRKPALVVLASRRW